MKVLLTVHQFFPDYFSGTEVLTHSVARELVGRGHEVTVFTGYPARTSMPDHERFDEYDIDGIHVHRFHHAYVRSEEQGSITEVEYNNLLAARYFARLVRDLEPDVIHFFHFSRLGAALIDVSTAAGVPAFYTPTDFWGVCPTSQLLLPNGKTCEGPSSQGGNCVKHVAVLNQRPSVSRWARRVPNWIADVGIAALKAGLAPPRLPSAEILAMSRRRLFIVERLNALNKIVAPTSLMVGVLEGNGVRGSLIRQSAYGIDLQGFRPRTRQRTSNQDPLTIGFIGTLAPHKGCLVLIEAFKKLRPDSGARLRIYGNPADFPDYFAQLEKAASNHPGIEFSGTFPNSQVADVVDGIDVLVVPSLWFENTPLVVCSAHASRVPVVASDFPGMSEVIRDRVNGMLFPAGDATALAARLSELVEQPELLTRLSARCTPPKSSAAYTEELLNCWQESRARSTLRSPQTIAPLESTRGDSYIVGWAVAEMRSPQMVAAYSRNGLLSKTSAFSPRPDVRNALRAQGNAIDDTSFGFQLVIPSLPNQPAVRLRVTSATGKTYDAALERCKKGESFAVDTSALIGVDDLRLASEAKESRA